MSEFTDLLLQTTDPVSALLLILIAWYMRSIKRDLETEIARVRKRTERLEGQHLPPRADTDD